MGTQLKGPLSAFSGKIGTIIGSIVKGRNIITSLHTKSNKPPAKAQSDQRQKFGLMTAFLSYLSDLAYTMQLPNDFSGGEVHCYMAFARPDGRVSNSIYAGALEVQ